MKIISLTQNSQFRYLYRRGQSAVMPTMVMYVAKNRTHNLRLGITAGKKVGGAVARNRAKRRIRELFRVSQVMIKPGYDICIVARTYTVHAPAETLSKDFFEAIKKLGVYCNEATLD